MSERKSLEQIANRLWDMASTLRFEHNIGKYVTNEISDLAGEIYDYGEMLKDMTGGGKNGE